MASYARITVASAVAVASITIAAACGTFGSSDAPAPEADASPTDAAPPPAPPDAATADGGSPSPCLSPHLLCDDFERTGAVLGGIWQDFDVASADAGTSSLTLAPGAGFGGSTALALRVVNAPGMARARQRLVFPVPVPPPPTVVTAARLSYRVRIEQRLLGDAGFLPISSLFFGGFFGANLGSNVEVSSTTGRVSFGGLPFPDGGAAPLDDAGGAWQRFTASNLDATWREVSLSVDFTTDQVVAKIDGTLTTIEPPVRALDFRFTSLTLYFGLYQDIATIENFVAYFDDVVLDIDTR